MPWWSHLPSLTPVKGFSRFLYVWTHWEEVSAELKRRDERLEAIEQATNIIVRLKEEAHEAEKRAIEQSREELAMQLGGAVVVMAIMLRGESVGIQESAMEVLEPPLRERVKKMMVTVAQVFGRNASRVGGMDVRPSLEPPRLP